MVNQLCECEAAGFCSRHRLKKNKRQYQLCRGLADTEDCGLKYWNAWEQGKLGATIQQAPAINPPGFCKQIRNRSANGSVASVAEMIPQVIYQSDSIVDPYSEGAGTELAQIFETFWIKPTGGCGCEESKQKMNEMGPQWCRENLKTILDWLKLEAKKRGIPFVRSVAKIMVNQAISRAERGHNAGGASSVEPVEFSSPVKRNFLMHVWPVAGFGAWQWNMDQVLQRAELFNGRRVVAIAVDSSTDHYREVMDYLKDFTDEFVVVKNNSTLREVITFRHLLKQVESDDPNEVTFCCHAKGVRHKISLGDQGSMIPRWTEAMYQTCLDNWDLVQGQLEQFAMTGSFRRFGMFRTPGNHRWHYSGTFYWFRNRDVFARDWRTLDRRFFGTESWPGRIFKPEETGCLFGDRIGDLYQAETWVQLDKELEEWRRKHLTTSQA